jgi:hypothetical protein
LVMAVKILIAVFWIMTPCNLVLTSVLDENAASTSYCANPWTCSSSFRILKMEAETFSETFITSYQTTRCHKPADYNLNRPYTPLNSPTDTSLHATYEDHLTFEKSSILWSITYLTSTVCLITILLAVAIINSEIYTAIINAKY